MSKIEWYENFISVDPPKHPKKITATRFATILGLNPWSTPFEVWCAITRTYEEPFEDTIYTKAGKAIEPKQIKYIKNNYFMPNLKTPTDIYGADYFKKTYGDFFKDVKIFGGMWDSITVDSKGNAESVLEFKTTKRAEDWKDNIPEYYALQAALYAYLLGVDDVIMIATFLEEKDYADPEIFEVNEHNTVTKMFRLSERYPTFQEDYIAPAVQWWCDYVETGISPEFDEKKDADILKALRTENLSPDTDIEELIEEADRLQRKIDKCNAEIKDDVDRLKTIKDVLKESAIADWKDGAKNVTFDSANYSWTIAKSTATGIDKDALKADGIYDKYVTKAITYKLTNKERT